MPRAKAKTNEVKKRTATKSTPVIDEEKIIDPDLLLEDEVLVTDIEEEDEELDEDDSLLAPEELDPFKDRWEE